MSVLSSLMKQIGDKQYPDIKLSEAIDYANYIVKCGGKISREDLSKGIGKKGGWLSDIISSMEAYGLIKRSGGVYEVTDLAKTIIFANQSEKELAMAEAYGRIDILKMAYQEFGDTIPDKAGFSAFLKSKITSDWTEIKKKTSKLLKLYLEAYKYLKLTIKPEMGELEMGAKPPTTKIDESVLKPEAPPAFIELKAGSLYQRFPYAIEGIEALEAMVKFLKRQITQQEKTQKEEAKGEGQTSP